MQIDYKFDQLSGAEGTILAEDIKQIRRERDRILIGIGANPDDIDKVKINDLLYRIEMGIAKSINITATRVELVSHKPNGLEVGDSISFITFKTIPDVTDIYVNGIFIYRFKDNLKPLSYYEIILTENGYEERTFSTTSDVGVAYNKRRRANEKTKAVVEKIIDDNDMSKAEKDALLRLGNVLKGLRNDFKDVQDFVDNKSDIPYVSEILDFRIGIVEGLENVTNPMLKEAEDKILSYRVNLEEYRVVIDEIALSIQTGIDACNEIEAKTIELDNYVASKRIVQDEDLIIHRAKVDDSMNDSLSFMQSYNHMMVPNIVGIYPSKGQLILDLDKFYSEDYVTFMERYNTFNFRLTRFEAQYKEDKLLLLPHIEKNVRINKLVTIGNYEDTIVEPLVSTTDAFLDKLEYLKEGIEIDSDILRQLSITDETISNVYKRFISASTTLNNMLDAVDYLVNNISDHPGFRDVIDKMWEDSKYINGNYNFDYIVEDYTVEEKAIIEPALTFEQSNYDIDILNLTREDGLHPSIQDIIDAKYQIVKDWTSTLKELFDALDARKESINISILNQMLPTQMHKDIKFPAEFIFITDTEWNKINKTTNSMIKFYDGAMIYNHTSNDIIIYASKFHDIDYKEEFLINDITPTKGDFVNFRNTLVYVTFEDTEIILKGIEYTLSTFRLDAQIKRIDVGEYLGVVVEAQTRGNAIYIRFSTGKHYVVEVDSHGFLIARTTSTTTNIGERDVGIRTNPDMGSFETSIEFVDSKMVKQFNPLSKNSNQLPRFRHTDYLGGTFKHGQGISIYYKDGKSYLMNINCF
jgi:hypothetical protein